MSRWRFLKMHGLGNDFVVIDERERESFPAHAVRRVCDRHLGVGADGVLVISAAGVPDASARMRVHNADGSPAEMCGNGIRCIALLLGRPGEKFLIQTDAGLLCCRVQSDALVEVEMGEAIIGSSVELDVIAGRPPLLFTKVRTGNPHLVTFDFVPPGERLALAPRIERSVEGGTNVEIARAQDGAIELEVWERGVGFTRACGTGACATVAAACERGFARRGAAVTVRLPGGELTITVPEQGSMLMRGPAELVFEGEIEI